VRVRDSHGTKSLRNDVCDEIVSSSNESSEARKVSIPSIGRSHNRRRSITSRWKDLRLGRWSELRNSSTLGWSTIISRTQRLGMVIEHALVPSPQSQAEQGRSQDTWRDSKLTHTRSMSNQSVRAQSERSMERCFSPWAKRETFNVYAPQTSRDLSRGMLTPSARTSNGSGS